jgi:hypothetical protein
MIQRIKGLLKRRGFIIFSRPFELNIVGLRNKNVRHTDEIHVFYKINAKNWNYHVYEGITDPIYLSKSKSPILLKEGQYINAFEIGKHKEKFTGLVQVKPVTVLENNDRASSFSAGESKNGIYHIDIIPETAFEKDDDGCQLLLGEENFKELMAFCKKHLELYGNQFTYTLIDFMASKRSFLKGIAIAASIISSLLFGYLFKEEKGKKRRKK